MAMGVTTWAMEVHEADDALGAAAAVADADERVEQVLIVTPDKDLGQCVRGTPGRAVRPAQARDHRRGRRARQVRRRARRRSPTTSALVGDSADGFPGLPGWGAKSAAAVLARYVHLEEIPDHAGQWDVPGLRGAPKLARTCRTDASWRCCSGGSPPSRPT